MLIYQRVTFKQIIIYIDLMGCSTTNCSKQWDMILHGLKMPEVRNKIRTGVYGIHTYNACSWDVSAAESNCEPRILNLPTFQAVLIIRQWMMVNVHVPVELKDWTLVRIDLSMFIEWTPLNKICCVKFERFTGFYGTVWVSRSIHATNYLW